MKIHSIPGKLDVSWLDDLKAILDKWYSYGVTLAEFREATLEKGLLYSKSHGGRAYIVDSSEATGVFSSEIQNFIGTDIFPAYAAGGIRYFITINSEKSTLTEMNVKTYSKKVGPAGIILVEVQNLDEAIDFLKKNP